jgi:hypothetical protein
MLQIPPKQPLFKWGETPLLRPQTRLIAPRSYEFDRVYLACLKLEKSGMGKGAGLIEFIELL